MVRFPPALARSWTHAHCSPLRVSLCAEIYYGPIGRFRVLLRVATSLLEALDIVTFVAAFIELHDTEAARMPLVATYLFIGRGNVVKLLCAFFYAPPIRWILKQSCCRRFLEHPSIGCQAMVNQSLREIRLLMVVYGLLGEPSHAPAGTSLIPTKEDVLAWDTNSGKWIDAKVHKVHSLPAECLTVCT
jgi:hypothetical protein